MSQQLTKIYFIHEGRESYPEIAAYRTFFSDRFICEEVHPDVLFQKHDLAQAVCWYIMGFYSKQPVQAGLIIHDYRSLSVGKTRWLKDLIKRFLNATPDIRIFQNAEIHKALGFRDAVSTVYLPMGVPSFVLDFCHRESAMPVCDFCYIGVMSRERKTVLMLNSFLKRFGATKSFHLYGKPESWIKQRYEDNANIVFQGQKSQQEVFAALRNSRVAVNYFPTHFPHRLQTPTKLLEYAALGLCLLCNEHPQSRRVVEAYGLNTIWGPTQDMFCNVPDDLEWDGNGAFDPLPLLWPSVVESSGIAGMIEKESGL